MKNKYNISIHIAVFLILLILYFFIGLLYEGIMLETSDHGSILNSVIIGITELLYFPFNTIFNPSSDLMYFLGIFINLNIYTVLICILSRKLLNTIRKNHDQ
jgi:hypothetical protein